MAKQLGKLAKVNESFTINRYDNGFMIEVGGRGGDDEWKNCKVLCNSEEDLFNVIKEALALPLEV